jgi:hypothetical protein
MSTWDLIACVAAASLAALAPAGAQGARVPRPAGIAPLAARVAPASSPRVSRPPLPAADTGRARPGWGTYAGVGAAIAAGAVAVSVLAKCATRCGDDSAGPYLVTLVPVAGLVGALGGTLVWALTGDRSAPAAQ